MRKVPVLYRWLILLALFFLSLMSLLRLGSWLAFNTSSVSFTRALPVFWLGFRYDARITGIVLLLILVFGSISVIHPFKTIRGKGFWIFYTCLFATLLVIFYVFDFLHYRYVSQRLNATALTFLEDAKISAGMVWQTYPVTRILLGMAASVWFLLVAIKFLYKKASSREQAFKTPAVIAWFAGSFLVLALAIFGRVGQYPLRWSDAFNLRSDFEANIALNPFQSFFSSLSFRAATFDIDKVRQYYPLMASYLGVVNKNADSLNFERAYSRHNSGSAIPPNIVLVICESFSAYKSSMWGNPLNTTPFFDEISKKGILFDNCFTPHFGTARGVWATITGIPDVMLVKTASRNPAMVDQHSIINDFQGYRKLYFLGGSTSWANIRGLLTNNIKGLELFEEGSYDVPKIDVWGISDKNLFLEAGKVLSREKGPFFAIIQTADNHRPYTIPEEDLAEFTREKHPQDTLRQYGFESNEELNAFRYTDFSFRKFMELAGKSHYYNNTIFVFIGDHGIHGNAGKMLPPAWTVNGLTGFHVPLLFYAPHLLQPRRVHQVVSQVDVMPTIAGLANISYTNTTLGRDVLHPGNDDEGTAFIMDHNNFDIGVVRGDYYYSRQLTGKREDLVWSNFNRVEPARNADSLLSEYRALTSAFYETARYLLLNNKKRTD